MEFIEIFIKGMLLIEVLIAFVRILNKISIIISSVCEVVLGYVSFECAAVLKLSANINYVHPATSHLFPEDSPDKLYHFPLVRGEIKISSAIFPFAKPGFKCQIAPWLALFTLKVRISRRILCDGTDTTDRTEMQSSKIGIFLQNL